MHSLLRLLQAPRSPSKAPSIQRDSIGFVLDDGRHVDVLRVRDPRARRIKLSVDERGARLSLPLRASLVAGERFLHEHRDWLGLQLAAQGEHAGQGLLRGRVGGEAAGLFGLCIRLVAHWVQRRLATGRGRQHHVGAGILEHVIGGGEFFQPEAGLATGVAQLVVRGQYH